MTITGERPASGPQAARRAMIDSQLRTSGVNEPWVLTAMSGVARENFVPAAMRAAAYIDRAISLGDGRFLAAPVVHGMMLTEAAPLRDDAALLIGYTDCYLAALLRPLVGSLEVAEPASFGAQGAGLPASSEGATYTLIVVDGAVEQLPAALTAHLRAGGRIVTGLVERGVTRLAVGRATGGAGAVSLLPLAELGIPVLADFAAPKRWSF